MNLIIDVGNTLVKFAVYQDKNLLYKTGFEIAEFALQYQRLKKDFSEVKHCIISSVGHLSQNHITTIGQDLTVLMLSPETPVPFKNLYKTQKTLGADRRALASAAVLNFPNNNVLVIDAGTCVTYDFKTSDNTYLGGAISPGLKLRYTSLNQLTANLPLLQPTQPVSLIGNSTETSIHVGVSKGLSKEIDGFIDDYRNIYRDLTVILTGGDMIFLSDQLKNSIFANSNFLFEGLNFILDYNTK